jgi:endoglucanase
MSLIADQPETKRFGSWTADPRSAIDAYLDRILDDQPGTVPLIATYRLQHLPCRGFADSEAEVERYRRWYDGFAAGIGNRPAVIFLEIDGLITAHCLNSRGQVIRYRELVYAMRKLTELPRTVVYLDAGAADATPYREMARRLIKSGVMRGQGFFLNSTHYNWTTSELAYGQRIARLLPQVRHFVVSTAANGQGPLRPKNRVRDGNEVRCNPPKRGLGPKPTANTGYLWADAFVWIGNPGRSAGHCKPGDPGVGVFHAPIALGLAQYANFRVTGPKTDRPTRR